MSLFSLPSIRPYVILSAAISLDGHIATLNGDSLLSNREDWIRVHHLRADSDAIMIGSGTVRADDSKLTVNEDLIEVKNINHPIRIVVSSDGMIPLNSRIIIHRPDIPTLIATTSRCSLIQTEKLEKRGCKIIKCGNGPLVDLSKLLLVLKTDFQVNKLMLEGGSQLNGAMLNLQFIDEIQLAIAPVICGQGIPLFKLSKAFYMFSESPFFDIKSYNQIGDMIWLKMLINYQSREIAL
ncbi:MAG: RibD family protein [Promethearchaeota archaeon]